MYMWYIVYIYILYKKYRYFKDDVHHMVGITNKIVNDINEAGGGGRVAAKLTWKLKRVFHSEYNSEMLISAVLRI